MDDWRRETGRFASFCFCCFSPYRGPKGKRGEINGFGARAADVAPRRPWRLEFSRFARNEMTINSLKTNNPAKCPHFALQ
jgi:hypothetical protein